MSDGTYNYRDRGQKRPRSRTSSQARLCPRCGCSHNPSIRSNNQNDPEYADEEYDVYPEDHPTEGEDDETEWQRDWKGETYFGKGVPNPDFKWGTTERERRLLYGSMRTITPSRFLRRGVVSESPEEIVDGLEPAIKQRAKGVSLSDKKYNPRLKLWTMKATSGGPTYTLKIRAPDAEGKFFDLWENDVEVSCTCPYWRWNGPEYHGKQEDYLKGNPRGTASPPDIQDPERDSFICKHMYKALKDLEDARKQERRRRKR